MNRNSLTTAPYASLDLRLSRELKLGGKGKEDRMLALALDAFNVLNHANLGNPDSLFTNPPSPTFGIATFGRQGAPSGFPALSPLNETPRQIQVSVKIEF